MEAFAIIGMLVMYAIIAVIVMAFSDEPLVALFWPFIFIFVVIGSLGMLITDLILILRGDKENEK